MANGGQHDVEAVWSAVDALRTQVQVVSERTAVLQQNTKDNKEDIDRLGKSIARLQGSLEAMIHAVEVRLEGAINASEERMNERFDRMRNWAIALIGVMVPLISALLGAIAQGGVFK